MKTLAVISILALLTMSGAAVTTRFGPTIRQRRKGRIELAFRGRLFGGTISMLSVDQILRLVSFPAVVAAFLIASHISGAVVAPQPSVQIASK